LSFSTVFFIAWPVTAQAVAVGQVSSLKMVVQLLILPVGFGRFYPRWQMVGQRTCIAESASGNDPRRRTAARNLAYIDGEPELRQRQTGLRMRQVH
jgi:hypothetical protein